MADSERSGMVLIVDRSGGNALCTGTLLNATWLITASHCFHAAHEGADGTIAPAYVGAYAFHFGNSMQAGAYGPFNPTVRYATTIIRHPASLSGFGVDGSGFPKGFDVTLVKLSSPAPSSAFPAWAYPNGRMRIYGGSNPSTVGQTLFVYGYGKNHGPNGPPWDSIGILRYGNLVASRAAERWSYLSSPFGDGTFILNNGDSGGPSFLDTFPNGVPTRQLVGVHSMSSGDDGAFSVSIDTHAEFFRDFVTTVIDEDQHPVSPQPGFAYKWRLQNSRKCLDVSGASTQAGAGVVQWTCHGNPNQRLALVDMGGGYYSAVFSHSHQCLEVRNGSIANGAPIVQQPCNGSSRQQFKLETWYPDGLWSMAGRTRLRWRHSSKCADLGGSNANNGAALTQYTCHENTNQQFTFLK
ncbi:MAG TPA: RICIN domain-containing protein [Polyangiaceae bacterium]